MKPNETTTGYLLLFRRAPDFPIPSPEEMQRMFELWSGWIEALVASGVSSGAERLDDAGAVVRGPRGATVLDGPYVDGREVVGGYIAVNAASISAATDIARGCPGLDHGYSVEVRASLCRSA